MAEAPVETEQSSNQGIATTLYRDLKQRGLQILEIKAQGVSALIGTNETAGAGFFEALQAKNPDGYIIGVGAGNAFTMLHCFPEGTVPKGVVLADIDPKAVAVGKLLVKQLSRTGLSDQFQSQFFGMPESDFNTSIQELISEEDDDRLKAHWQAVDSETWHKVWEELGKREPIPWDEEAVYKYEGQNVDVVGAILEKYPVLKQLAMRDNIAIAYADFTDPEFIAAVRELPEFENSTNIVYFSNIMDHITVRGTRLGQASVIESLRAYEHVSKLPIFIDTLGQRLNYYLRARNTLARFTAADFRSRGVVPRSQKPEGLLFEDEFETADLSQLNTEELENLYQRFTESEPFRNWLEAYRRWSNGRNPLNDSIDFHSFQLDLQDIQERKLRDPNFDHWVKGLEKNERDFYISHWSNQISALMKFRDEFAERVRKAGYKGFSAAWKSPSEMINWLEKQKVKPAA